MNLRLIREPTRDGVTFGVLFINGHFHSHCLEDPIREVPGQPVSAWKVPHETAIPAGRYEVKLLPSERLQRVVPRLLNVPGFTGILIHPGNTAADTSGCLLPGLDRIGPRSLGRSRLACESLIQRIAVAAECWIAIENPTP